MKKEYVKPMCEHIAFNIKEALMDTIVDGGDDGEFNGSIGEGVEDW